VAQCHPGSSGGAWGSDGGTANNKAASNASNDNNSTWGSHGSEADADMADMACDEALEEAVGISRAASAQHLADTAAAADTPAAAAAAAAGDAGRGSSGSVAAMESDGELDASAALAAETLGPLSAPSSPAAAAGGGGGVAGGSSSGQGGLLGSGGVPVQPLDIWASPTQVGGAVGVLVSGECQGRALHRWCNSLRGSKDIMARGEVLW
jgi:hypothetical protein